MGVNSYLYFNKNKNYVFFLYFATREICDSSLKSTVLEIQRVDFITILIKKEI